MGVVLAIVCVVTASIVGIVKADDKVQLTLLWRDSIHGAVSEGEVWQQVIDEFEARNPGISVKLVITSEYDTKLTLMEAGGIPVDLFSSVGGTGLATYVLDGKVRSIDDFVERDKFDLSVYSESVLDACMLNGKLYGLPVSVAPPLILYNKDLFDKAGLNYLPSTWDTDSWTYGDMVEVAKKLTLDIDGDGESEQFGLQKATRSVGLWGGKWFDDAAYKTGLPRHVNVDDTEIIIKAVDEYGKLYHEYCVAPLPGESADFFDQTAALRYANASHVSSLTARGKTFGWAVGPNPKAVTREDAMYTDPLLITSWSKHPEEAWRFVKFAIGEKGQSILQRGISGISASKELTHLTMMRYPSLSETDVVDIIYGGFDHARENLSHKIAYWNRIGSILSQPFNDVREGDKSPSVAVQDAIRRLSAVLKEIAE